MCLSTIAVIPCALRNQCYEWRVLLDSFSYISVLLSIVIGLAITQVLQGLRVLMLTRETARLYAPSLIWTALVLLIAMQCGGLRSAFGHTTNGRSPFTA